MDLHMRAHEHWTLHDAGKGEHDSAMRGKAPVIRLDTYKVRSSTAPTSSGYSNG